MDGRRGGVRFRGAGVGTSILAIVALLSAVGGSVVGVTGAASIERPHASVGPVYAVNFTAQGLQVGVRWNLTIGVSSYSSTLLYLVVSEPNGTYSYTADTGAGGTASGSFEVAGGPLVVHVTFAPAGSAPPASSPANATSGASVGVATPLVAVGAVVVIALVIGVAVATARRRAGPPAADRSSETLPRSPSVESRPPNSPDEAPDPLDHML